VRGDLRLRPSLDVEFRHVLAATGTLSWSFNEPSTNWQDDTDYRINARTVDLAGNLSPSTTQTFTYDSSRPTIVIQDPNTVYEKALPVISGTAGDGSNTRKSGLVSAEIAIQLNPAGGGNWWTGNTFSILDSDFVDDGGDAGSTGWISLSTTTDGGAWTLDVSSMPVWSNGSTYMVRVRAKDNALNYSNPIASYTFTYDSIAPISTVTYPAIGSFPSVISSVLGTASDATSGVTQVWVSIGEVSGPTTNYFVAGAFAPGSTEYYNMATGTTTWTYAPTISYTSGSKYLFRSYAIDASNNTQSPLFTQVGVFFDNVNKVPRDIMNGWEYDAGKNQVVFYGPACDDLKNGVVKDLDIVFGCDQPTPN
jgi:hypothetical protein